MTESADMSHFSNLLCLASGIVLIGCGDSQTTRPMPTAPPPIVTLDFSTVTAEIERVTSPDIAVIIGDQNGTLYTYEKGNMRTDRAVNVASAAKLITGLGLWTLVENGTVSPESRAAEYVSDWTQDPSDARYDVTLAQLMSFTSGFAASPAGDGCHGEAALTLAQCVAEIYAGDVRFPPGDVFTYGPDHMTIAAEMARNASGRELSEIIKSDIFDKFGLSSATKFSTAVGDNIRYSGGASGLAATGEDYSKILKAILNFEIVANRNLWQADRTPDQPFASQFPALNALNLDWHYGWGFGWNVVKCPSHRTVRNSP